MSPTSGDAYMVAVCLEMYGLSQAEFGARLGISQGQISHIAAGRKRFSPLVRAILCHERTATHFLTGKRKVGGPATLPG